MGVDPSVNFLVQYTVSLNMARQLARLHILRLILVRRGNCIHHCHRLAYLSLRLDYFIIL